MKALILSAAFAASWAYASPWTQRKWPSFIVGLALLCAATVAAIHVIATAKPQFQNSIALQEIPAMVDVFAEAARLRSSQ